MKAAYRVRVALAVLAALELTVLVLAIEVLGGWLTVGVALATSLTGGLVVASAGHRAWTAVGAAVRSGRPPEREVGDAALDVAGGGLLILPGFVTDLVGALLVLPPTRDLTRRAIARIVPIMPVAVVQPRPRPNRGSGDVVEGQVIDPPEPPSSTG